MDYNLKAHNYYRLLRSHCRNTSSGRSNSNSNRLRMNFRAIRSTLATISTVKSMSHFVIKMVYIKIMMMDSEVNFLLYNFITLAFPTFNGFGPESFLNPFSSVNFQTKLQQEKEASQTPRTLDDNITFQRKHEPEILSIRRRRGRGRGRGRSGTVGADGKRGALSQSPQIIGTSDEESITCTDCGQILKNETTYRKHRRLHEARLKLFSCAWPGIV